MANCGENIIDCFNCKYPDCVASGPFTERSHNKKDEKTQEQKEIDRKLKKKQKYAYMRQNGLCVNCGKVALSGFCYCEPCRDKNRIRHKIRYEQNKSKNKKQK